MQKKLIMLDNLSIGYRGQSVLSGITLSIDHNSFTAILGANGAGKSTLLKTLLGLLPPISGQIKTMTIDGSPPVFGYVPQFSQFDPYYLLTGFEVALMGTYGRLSPGRFISAHEQAFTHECLSAAGAEEFANKQFSELSGGQKQRVLIARALATRPDILMLDEPTAGVDHKATHAVMEFIAQIRTEKKITILLVTHDFTVVRRHAEQVIWLHQGNLLTGVPDELLDPGRMAEILEMGAGN